MSVGIEPREIDDNPLQYCLETAMDRGVWWVTGRGVTGRWT